MAVDSTACKCSGLVRTCSSTANVQDLLLDYSSGFTISEEDLLSSSLAVSLTSLEIASGTATVIDLLTIIQHFNFDAQFLNL